MNSIESKILKLGVTGGIGSGKSTVCKVFCVLGIPVFSADDESKRIVDTDRDLQEKLNTITGKNLFSTGILDRGELARLIFTDNDLLKKVNATVHPVVFEYFSKWVTEQDSPYVIMEAAILFESGASEMMDRVLTIITPLEERIGRLLKGNKFTREQIIERINNQIDDGLRIKQSDYVIFNSENDLVIPSVLGIHEDMLKLYNKI